MGKLTYASLLETIDVCLSITSYVFARGQHYKWWWF